jgi:ankyrin repeat protein
MHYACFCGHGDAVLMLLEGGGDPNKVGHAMLIVDFVVCAVTIPAALPWSLSCNPHSQRTLMLFVFENQPSKDGKTPIESEKGR